MEAQKLAKAEADQLMALVRNHQATAAQMKAHGWQWVNAKAVGRYSTSVNGSILNAAFQLARPSKEPSINVFDLASHDVAVVQLLAISEAKDATLAPIQQRVMAEQIASGYAQLDYQLYVNGVMSKASIKVNAPAPV